MSLETKANTIHSGKEGKRQEQFPKSMDPGMQLTHIRKCIYDAYWQGLVSTSTSAFPKWNTNKGQKANPCNTKSSYAAPRLVCCPPKQAVL